MLSQTVRPNMNILWAVKWKWMLAVITAMAALCPSPPPLPSSKDSTSSKLADLESFLNDTVQI